uniref:Uncharacterized protein n=1 Tax=Romanomermis culicivorax TaxID=13658 RepID=A0A915HXX6_ROMCU
MMKFCEPSTDVELTKQHFFAESLSFNDDEPADELLKSINNRSISFFVVVLCPTIDEGEYEYKFWKRDSGSVFKLSPPLIDLALSEGPENDNKECKELFH